ncbi:MAG: helix-turn-helix domain-containing protein [Anaerolineae bacterium]|nr:helix-turn-helix domain-containing protein [Anaerolineae bacterium]
MTFQTILHHLTRYMETGQRMQGTDSLLRMAAVSQEVQATVYAAFDELGTARLKPVFDRLNEQVSYDALRVLRVCYLNQRGG